jgi:type II secretory pathway pseudopilin PulG
MRGTLRSLEAVRRSGGEGVGVAGRRAAGFTLLEALIMLGVLAVFTLLLAGVLKGRGEKEADQAAPVTSKSGENPGAVAK